MLTCKAFVCRVSESGAYSVGYLGTLAVPLGFRVWDLGSAFEAAPHRTSGCAVTPAGSFLADD